MRTFTFRFVSVLAVSLLSQGCVGVFVGGRDTTTIKNPSVIAVAGVDGVKEGSSSAEYTAAWLKSNWGSPASVKAVSGGAEERWTYDFEQQCWCGVMPMLIIPVPLMVPTGHEKVVFLLKDGRVVSAKRVKQYRAMAIAGLFSPEGPFATSYLK